MVDLAALTGAIFAQLATASAGSAVRAQLGAGAAGVIMIEDLRRYEGKNRQLLPTPPLIALRPGPAPISDRVLWLPFYTWLLADDPSIGGDRLRTLAPLIAAAYEDEIIIPTVGLVGCEVSAGQPYDDRALGLTILPLTLAATAF